MLYQVFHIHLQIGLYTFVVAMTRASTNVIIAYNYLKYYEPNGFRLVSSVVDRVVA
jgi:hypothetical protein